MARIREVVLPARSADFGSCSGRDRIPTWNPAVPRPPPSHPHTPGTISLN
jgi:hypothetical protein